ncbi:MAG: GAF domain-containing protein [Thalassotalea sp.]
MDRFLKLTTKLTNPSISTKDKLNEICLTTAAIIQGTSRVSLWRFTENFDAITCTICYDLNEGSFTSEQVLHKSDYTEYFTAILAHEVINAADARAHPATKCFTTTYFKPLKIYSLLDFILYRDFQPYGVICCESVNKSVNWTDEDVESLKRIARSSSMYFTPTEGSD